MAVNRVIVFLGVLGLVPFVASSLLVALGEPFGGVDPGWLFMTYSVVILCFLSGTLWGKCLNVAFAKEHRVVLILSNLLALLAWGGLLLAFTPGITLVALAVGYIGILWIEIHYERQLESLPNQGYLKMRMVLTGIVLATHLVMIASLGGGAAGT